jgi:hypothetical protein
MGNANPLASEGAASGRPSRSAERAIADATAIVWSVEAARLSRREHDGSKMQLAIWLNGSNVCPNEI